MADEEPKIIIDEDWKEQVRREREQASKEPQESAEETGAEEEAEASPFAALVQSLATQALFALGLIAPQDAQQVTVDLPQAQWLIDMLMALREKTKGNLTPEEEGQLTETVAELQRAYMVRAQQAQEAALKNSGVNPQDLGTTQ